MRPTACTRVAELITGTGSGDSRWLGCCIARDADRGRSRYCAYLQAPHRQMFTHTNLSKMRGISSLTNNGRKRRACVTGRVPTLRVLYVARLLEAAPLARSPPLVAAKTFFSPPAVGV